MSKGTETDWHGCYDDGWGDLIVPEAFAHPAKFAYGLIQRIIAHGVANEYWRPGETIGDPFGGIGCGGIIAAYAGIGWIGVELEQRFVDLAEQNFSLHQRRWELLGVPLPKIIQGDSRNFSQIVCDGIVTSPPYAANRFDGGEESLKAKQGHSEGYSARGGYGENTPGQIGRLPAGDMKAVVTSPPYADTSNQGGDQASNPGMKWSDGERADRGKIDRQNFRGTNYGSTPGNIGNLKACVTSPPWENQEGTQHPRKFADPEAFAAERDRRYASGKTKGHPASAKAILAAMNRESEKVYGASAGQLGNESGETYWQAVAQVYSECMKAMKPGGVIAVVIKDYVKNKKRVPLCDQSWELLQRIGFKPIERIRAWLVEEETHRGLFGQTIKKRKERKSFFRRLAEKKGSPKIDWEEVLFLRAKQ